MDPGIAATLDERTKTLVQKMNTHEIEDDRNFREVAKAIEGIKISQARSGVIIGIIVVAAQIVVGAWVKGLF